MAFSITGFPKFAVVGIDNPEGYKPGRYYYVVYLPEWRKVSRYVRRLDTATYKLDRYVAKYAAGERYWPEVGRSAELRDSRYVVLTIAENFRRWASQFFAPAMATRERAAAYGGCAGGSCDVPPMIRLP